MHTAIPVPESAEKTGQQTKETVSQSLFFILSTDGLGLSVLIRFISGY